MQAKNDKSLMLDSAETMAALRIGKSKLNELLKKGMIRRSVICTGRSLFPVSEVNRLANVLQEPAI